MVTKRIDLNDASLTLEDLLTQLEPDTEILIVRGDEPVARVESTQPPPVKKRVLGLHEGQGWISDDFTDELPDEFWLGEA